MKKRKFIKVVLMVLIFVTGGLILYSAHALAPTQGDVAIKLATLLGLNHSSAENAIGALKKAGIDFVWNPETPVTEAFIGGPYRAVNSAIKAGKITPPFTIGSASALVAAAATAAGLPSQTVVKSIVAAGGDKYQASSGASYGVLQVGAPQSSSSSVLRQKSLYFDCHSGLDPESSICELDSRWSLPRT